MCPTISISGRGIEATNFASVHGVYTHSSHISRMGSNVRVVDADEDVVAGFVP